MSLLKDWRLVLLLVLLILSAYLLLPPLVFKKSGVQVTFLETNSKCANIKEGSIISSVNGITINNINDFERALDGVKNGNFVALIVDSKPGNCIAIKDNEIGLVARNIESSNLKFGIDIHGGTRVLLQPKSNVTNQIMSDTFKTLQTRVDLSGLRDIRITPIGQNLIQIETTSSSGDDIKNFLAKQGKFEGKIFEEIVFTDGIGKLILGDNNYQIKLIDNGIEVNNNVYTVNQTFVIDEIKFDVYNVSNNSVLIMTNVFTGSDIVAVLTDPQHSFIQPVENGYRFSFTVQITKDGAKRFAKVTKNQPVIFAGSESYIKSKLVLFLDNVPVSELNIVSNLAGQEVTTPAITGFGQTQDKAVLEKLRLQSILKSGSLPVELEIVKIDEITQTTGKGLINSTVYVALAAALAVSTIIFIRYRDFKIAVPMVLISFSEIIIILGFAALTQVLTKGNGWVLDIPAIAGLIAIIGTGVNQLIIITDQILLEPEQSLRYRHKTAMAIILNSAYMVVAAMIPLIILGVGTLRGFAITTIVGVFIAIAVTRPAYMAILEKVKKLE